VTLFSIVVPTYNRPEMLHRAVESVLAQTVSDFEVIVVNDEGEEPALPPDNRIRLISQAHAGPAAARNRGIQEAVGRYVCFLDDDDAYTSGRLAIALEGLTTASATVCSKDDGSSASQNVSRFERGQWVHVGQVALVQTRCPAFDPSFDVGEDVDWFIRLANKEPLRIVDAVGYLWNRNHGVSRLTDMPERMLKGRLNMMERHPEFFDRHPATAAYQWKLVGGEALTIGDRSFARRALVRSLRLRPSLRTLYHLARAMAP
jgi:glycosyltransferase involved in cell wall biosynthesis